MKYAILGLTLFIVKLAWAQDPPGWVARWTMNDNCQLTDESTVSPANGTLVDVTLTTDRGNHTNAALSFSSNTYITLGVVDKLKLADDKSITFWINPTLSGSNRTGSILKYGNAISIGYEEQSSVTRLNIMFGNVQYMLVNLTPGVWQSVTITFVKNFNSTQSKAFCYIGGFEVASAVKNKSTHNFDKSIVVIGAESQAVLTNGFWGKLDDMRAYDRVLSGTEALNIALPVKPEFFKGKRVKGAVELHWRTALEENVSHFFVQKSLDGINFDEIYKADAGKFNYLAYDLAGIPALFAWYRLQIVDQDGRNEFSNVIRIASDASSEEIVKFFPNPGSRYINITGVHGIAKITILNNSGKAVMQKQFLAGNVVDISSLPPGLYYMILFDGTNHITSKFVKQ